MRFSVLGPLQVIGDDGAEVRFPQPRQRVLLTVLLLHANQTVSVSRLAESLQERDGLAVSPGALRTQIWAVRKLLAPARRLHTSDVSGYLMDVRAGELDAAEFRRVAEEGRQASGSGELEVAVRFLTQALALWGEPALADVPQTLAMGPVAQRLLDERVAVRELLNEARLGLGQHASLIPELRECTAADPANERLWEQLMLALAGAGRTDEALAAYQQARTWLTAELGLEPGYGLQRLHQRILAGDPALVGIRCGLSAVVAGIGSAAGSIREAVTARMEFCLLGPLLVRRGSHAVVIAQGKQKALLAALLLRGNYVVTIDELIELLWASTPPRSARVTLQNYVKRLRGALDADGRRICTQPGGYMISLDPSELDVNRSEAMLDTARAAAVSGAWLTTARQARQALSLWRGEPLADVRSDALERSEVPRLTEMRLQLSEIAIEADLHLHRHTHVIGELLRLIADAPLRERLHALLMLALLADARRAEALACYQRAREILVSELGVEPGLDLRLLHQRILADDCEPALAPRHQR